MDPLDKAAKQVERVLGREARLVDVDRERREVLVDLRSSLVQRDASAAEELINLLIKARVAAKPYTTRFAFLSDADDEEDDDDGED